MKRYLLALFGITPAPPNTQKEQERKARDLQERLNRLARDVEVMTHDPRPENSPWTPPQ